MGYIGFFVLFLILAHSSVVQADVYRIPSTTVSTSHPYVIGHSLAMHAPFDTPATAPPGNGRSYIKLQLTVESKQHITGSAQVAIMMSDDTTTTRNREREKGLVGYLDDDHQPRYCCTEELHAQGAPGCTKPGTLIIDPSPYVTLWSASLEFSNSSKATLDSTYPVEETGVYVLIFANCDPNMDVLSFSGLSEWLNPYGYLSGLLYHFLPFYEVMSYVYLVGGVLWGINMVRCMDHLTHVQYSIGGAMLLCQGEVTAWYFFYLEANRKGSIEMGVLVFAMMLSVLRCAGARILVLVISLGYGITTPSLGSYKRYIWVLGVSYVLAEGALETTVRVSQSQEVHRDLRLLVSLPVAVLNAVFYWWTCISLFRVLQQLRVKGEAEKLAKYRKLSGFLVCLGLIAVAFACYELYFMAQDLGKNWSYVWLIQGGFPTIAYSILLAALCGVWLPRKPGHGYSSVPPEQEPDEFGLERVDDLVPVFSLGQDDQGQEVKVA